MTLRGVTTKNVVVFTVIPRMSCGAAEDRSPLHCIWRWNLWGLGKGIPTSKNQVSAVISKNPFLGRVIILG